jgi:hypothetical protein
MAATVSMTASVLPSAPNGLFDGEIWPKAGCASTAYAATASLQLSSPGLSPIPREIKKVSRHRPPLTLRPQGVRRRSPWA